MDSSSSLNLALEIRNLSLHGASTASSPRLVSEGEENKLCVPILGIDAPQFGLSFRAVSPEANDVLSHGTALIQTAPGTEKYITKTGPIELQQLQYRSYKYSISLYHFSEYLYSLQFLRNDLTQASKGYRYSLTGPNPLPLSRFPVPKGDEIPVGTLEVAYLPNIFQGKGSAIGFRDHKNDTVEWLCFREPAEYHIQNAKGPNGEALFDKVAYIEKGGTGEKGHPEHRAWYESVKNGRKKEVALKLTWKNMKAEERDAFESGNTRLGERIVSSNRKSNGSGLRVRLGTGANNGGRGLLTPRASPEVVKKNYLGRVADGHH